MRDAIQSFDWAGLARFMVPAAVMVAMVTHLSIFVCARIRRRIARIRYEKRQEAPVLPPYLHYEEFKRDLLDKGVSIYDILERCRGSAPPKPPPPLLVAPPFAPLPYICGPGGAGGSSWGIGGVVGILGQQGVNIPQGEQLSADYVSCLWCKGTGKVSGISGTLCAGCGGTGFRIVR